MPTISRQTTRGLSLMGRRSIEQRILKTKANVFFEYHLELKNCRPDGTVVLFWREYKRY